MYVDDNNMAMESIGKGTRLLDQTPETEDNLNGRKNGRKRTKRMEPATAV